MTQAICRQGLNVLNNQRVPIIFVPGVMGTRLQIGSQFWNPESRWNMVHWVTCSASTARKELDPTITPATVMSTNTDVKDGSGKPFVTPERAARGWAGPTWNFYGDFLLSLEQSPFSQTCPVYAFGYDWRQSNTISGTQLVDRINQIISAESADAVIIITHSMGGLVTRSGLFQNPGIVPKVMGVIHCFQPVTGAAVACRRFFTGATSVDDDPAGMARILGNTADKTAQILCGAAGPIQLLPSNNYQDTSGPSWFYQTDDCSPPVPFAGDVYDLYRQAVKPPGLVSAASKDAKVRAARTALGTSLTNAQTFHATLGAYKHPHTWCVYGTGLDTDMVVPFDLDGNCTYLNARRPEGDGTVPLSSATALFPGQQYSAAESVDREKHQFAVSGITHSGAMKSADVQTVITNVIANLFACSAAKDLIAPDGGGTSSA